MFNNLTEDNLLASGIKNDDLKAFEVLYLRYKKKLYQFSLRYLKESAEAEEIVQAVFVSLWEHRKTLDTSLSIKSYIYKSAVNNIYNSLKKKATVSNYVEREMLNPEKSSNTTYEHMYYKDLEKKIGIIFSELTTQQQNIFQLSRLEGLPNQEIAARLNLSTRTVENQIYRVTKIIRQKLKRDLQN